MRKSFRKKIEETIEKFLMDGFKKEIEGYLNKNNGIKEYENQADYKSWISNFYFTNFMDF